MKQIRVAFLICSNVIGGHEFQSAALASSMSDHFSVKIFVNRAEHIKVFSDLGLDVELAEGVLLEVGSLAVQWARGWINRHAIRKLVTGFDHVIVCAGAVEAGVASGIALKGHIPNSMYLPFFYDRVPVWGWKGGIYNCMLASFCTLFDRVITINRIQAHVINVFSGVSAVVVTNKIRDVHPPLDLGPPRLVFVGRLDHQKRIGELIEWLDTPANPVRELLLIGDGPLRKQLEHKADRLAYLKCSFLGWRSPEEQDRIIRGNDILVLNSLLEGEPLVIREARARGMKIVARNIVGTRGVTARTERYASQTELHSCIFKSIDPGLLDKSTQITPSFNASNYKRDFEIRKVCKLISQKSNCIN